MNNKIKKYSLLILLTLVTFFSLNINAQALNAYGVMPRRSSYNPETLTYKRKGISDGRLALVGIYMVASGSSDTNKQHAYCIEPGTVMPSNSKDFNAGGYKNASSKELGDYALNSKEGLVNNEAKLSMIKQILNYAPKLTSTELDKAIKLYKDCYNNCSTDNMKPFEKVFGAQGLIWEVATGERTSLKNDNGRLSNGFYNSIKNRTDLVEAKNQYDSILKKIRNSFYSMPGGGGNGYIFSSGASKEVPMTWKDDKFVLEVIDIKGSYGESDKFKYWEVSDSAGLNVSIDKSGTKLTITSNSYFDGSKTIKIKIKTPNGTSAKAYYKTDTSSNQYQDVTTIGGTSLEASIKVNTPKYQIKITKKAWLDKENLEGAKFDICTDASCLKVIDRVVTDKDGIAISKKIPNPGNYYIKETNTLPGYETDNKPKPVVVYYNCIADSGVYGNVTIINKNKEFDLIKYTIDENGEKTVLEDGCGTDSYTGPEFEVKDSKGNLVYMKELEPGKYEYTSDKTNAVSKIKTCNGEFKVYTLPECTYTISETKAPDGLTLPANMTQTVNTCTTSGVQFTNGFTGLEFRKKDESGNLVAGGKFAIQVKQNNVYKDVLLKENGEGSYEYDSALNKDDEDATYIFTTDNGVATITKLAPGEYRIVEKEAPEGYEIIEDKDSKALITIKDSEKEDYYLVEMVNEKVNTNGSEASAELIVTITTGRKVLNYALIIGSLIVLLVVAIVLRKKFKK